MNKHKVLLWVALAAIIVIMVVGFRLGQDLAQRDNQATQTGAAG